MTHIKERPAPPEEPPGTVPAWLASLWTNTPLRRAAVVIVHVVLWMAALSLALRLRFDGAVPPHFAAVARQTLLLLLAARLLTFSMMGLFHGLWRYAGFPELEKIVAAITASSALVFLCEAPLLGASSPRSIYVGEWLASIVLVGGARLAVRSVVHRLQHRERILKPVRTLIIGAGDAGESFLRDMQRMRDGRGWLVEGFLDDDRYKQGATMRGVKVLGAADANSIRNWVAAKEIELVVLAMPTAPGWRMREIVQACNAAGAQVKTVPALADFISSGGSWNNIREVNIEDLLRREPVKLDNAQIAGLVHDQVVLVTGAGGSIGSELCRQVLRYAPASLLLLDHDENALFEIERDLRSRGEGTRLVPLIADICDKARIDDIFARHRPTLVLHAAAHKHVAMMEQNPCEAAKNNVFGTRVVAETANAHGTGTFVLISTDKAVRPSSVMGCTKRVTEMIVQHLAQISDTRFIAVRFGNVLGSAGSVVPIFRSQIAAGGPVTVTHPEVTRYFMTIPEASQLVLQAAVLGNSGEIMVLDMGEPVKIVDLARDLIELSGLRLGIDIQIEFTGLKQGEKLTEELVLEHEGYDRTAHPKIMVGRIQPVVPGAMELGLSRLRQAAQEGNTRRTREALSALVPEARLAPDREPAVLLDSPSLQVGASVVERLKTPALVKPVQKQLS